MRFLCPLHSRGTTRFGADPEHLPKAALPWILTLLRLKLTHLLYCSCVRTKSVVEQLLAYQLVLPSVPPTRTNVNNLKRIQATKWQNKEQ